MQAEFLQNHPYPKPHRIWLNVKMWDQSEMIEERVGWRRFKLLAMIMPRTVVQLCQLIVNKVRGDDDCLTVTTFGWWCSWITTPATINYRPTTKGTPLLKKYFFPRTLPKLPLPHPPNSGNLVLFFWMLKTLCVHTSYLSFFPTYIILGSIFSTQKRVNRDITDFAKNRVNCHKTDFTAKNIARIANAVQCHN